MKTSVANSATLCHARRGSPDPAVGATVGLTEFAHITAFGDLRSDGVWGPEPRALRGLFTVFISRRALAHGWRENRTLTRAG